MAYESSETSCFEVNNFTVLCQLKSLRQFLFKKLPASAVMRSIAGKRMRIDGYRRAADIILDLPPMNEDTTAEEYAVELAAPA